MAWLNKNQRDTDFTLAGGRGGRSPGQTLATAVVGPKAIDRSKDLNVCTLQYVDNGMSLSR